MRTQDCARGKPCSYAWTCLDVTPRLDASPYRLASVWWTDGKDCRGCRMPCDLLSKVIGEEHRSSKYDQVPSA
jgi:hypothetical protein